MSQIHERFQMEIQKLRGFYWAIQCLSFSEAAEKIHVSQSAISHQVKALEEELGVKLYERVGRGIVPTPEGERLAHYARRILHAMDDLKSEFAELSGHPHGTIRVAAIRGMVMFHLPWIIKRFRVMHPEVRLSVSSTSIDTEILKRVGSGEADIGITSSWNEFEDVEYFETCSYDMYVCIPLDHEWVGRRTGLSLNEIVEQPLILYEKGTAERRRIDQVFARHGLQPDVRIEVGGPVALKEYVRTGLGITILSGLIFSQDHSDVIHTIPVSDLFGELGYGLVLRKGRYVSTAVREFMRAAGVAQDKIPTVA
jgi:DNA-binding transcriptional LysR family regulator